MKIIFDLKKSLGKEKANQEIYSRLENFFHKEISTPANATKANHVVFITSEIVDNIYINEINNFSNIHIEIEKHSGGEVSFLLEHDGNEFNPFDINNPTIKIQTAIKKLQCTKSPSCDVHPRNSAGEYVALRFEFNFINLPASKPYSYTINDSSDEYKITFVGKIIRGWGIETDEELIKLLETAKKESSKKVVYFDFSNVSFWDTKGSLIVLQPVIEINSKNSKRARVIGDKELQSYIPHLEKEITNQLIYWP